MKMLKKLQIRSLSDSCLAQLANLIVSTLSYAKYMSDDIGELEVVLVEINQYMSCIGTPWNIYQDLLRVILTSEHLNANMRYTCMQLLLNCGVNLLVTEVFPFAYYERVLQVIATQGIGLRVLDLKGVWVKEENMHYMFQIVKNCSHLQKLIIPYIANDDLLVEISEHCRQLMAIDISGETDVTEIGLDALSRGVCCHNLTVVNMGVNGEDNICPTDAALILQYCPNVETLGTYSFVGKALRHICQSYPEFECKLRYLHDLGTDDAEMKAIVTACPNLESLYLNAPQPEILHYLRYMKVSKLKLHRFSGPELIAALQRCGCGLRMTHLTLIKGRNGMDISDLARFCPQLTDLDFYLNDGLTYTRCHITFEQLEGLEMLSSPMATSTLKTLLCNLTSLKRLAIDHVEFNDDDIVSIFCERQFDKIEDIWFTLAANLTVLSIELLLERCPELQNVGQLSGWNLSRNDLELIRTLLKSANSSVVFTPIDVFP